MREPTFTDQSVVENTSPVAGSRHINRRPFSSTSKRTGELDEIARILPHCSEVSSIRALPHSDHSFLIRTKLGTAKEVIIAMIAITTRSSGRVKPFCPFSLFSRCFTYYLMNERVFVQMFFRKNRKLIITNRGRWRGTHCPRQERWKSATDRRRD